MNVSHTRARDSAATPSYGRYNVPLFNPQQSSRFWPAGGWATIQCAALGLIILVEVMVIWRELARHL